MRATDELSAGCLELICSNWLGRQLTSDDEERLRACSHASELIASCVFAQLRRCGFSEAVQWRGERPIVVGYVNALADALAKRSGERSRWATALIALPALAMVLKSEWVEDNACREAQRLWESRDAAYLAGIAAAKLDVHCLDERARGLLRLLEGGVVDLAGPAFARKSQRSQHELVIPQAGGA